MVSFFQEIRFVTKRVACWELDAIGSSVDVLAFHDLEP